jgi:ABC-2 type transport system permease protein
MSMLRLIAVGWIFNLKSLRQSAFFVFTAILQPVIFATIAVYMFRAGERQGTLFSVSLGAALMGMWSSTLFGSGGAITWQRFQGTLELLVAAPRPFIVILLSQTLATATLGIYSLVATMASGWILFDIKPSVEHPVLFALSIPVTVLGLGLLGLVFASTFVLYRNSSAFSNLLEYPVWLASGLLVPISVLPGWARPLSWLLAPTWGIRAFRAAAFGGSALPGLGVSLALGGAYVLVAAVLIVHFERLARELATMALR